MTKFGQIVILNGAPRSGKSSIVTAMQARFDGVWINLGVDVAMGALPERYRPGIGLRPGGERPDLEPLIIDLYLALYDSIAAHARRGLNVVAEFGHHDSHSKPLGILGQCARRLEGLSVLFVGVRCPIEEIMRRRNIGAEHGQRYVTGTKEDPAPEPVRRWQEEVHRPGIYDLEIDSSELSVEEAADLIGKRLGEGNAGSAFARLIDL